LLQTAAPTTAAALPLPELYRRVERQVPLFEWPILADDIAARRWSQDDVPGSEVRHQTSAITL
jgi:hypothetical protein